MNKLIYFFTLIILFFSTLSLNHFFNTKKTRKVISELKSSLVDNKKNNIISIINPIRNLLLQGNIRGARTMLVNYIDELGKLCTL